VSLVVTALLAATPAYIHFAPGDLPKFCKESLVVRVLEVTKFDADAGVVVFKATDTLKGTGAKSITSFKQVIDPKAKGVKPIFDWVAKGKTAVLFTIEKDAADIACGYVVIDGFWYSVDYNFKGEYWAFLRADPHLSEVYHGDADKLVPLVKDLLAGKKVDVPTKKADKVPTKDERFTEVNDRLIENRGLKK
jgi:hypothetical protein